VRWSGSCAYYFSAGETALNRTMKLRFSTLMTLAVLAAILSCDDSATQVAREAAQRQAQQNNEMARVTSESAATTRRLVEEQGQSRHELHAERTQLSAGWNDLEVERQAIAGARQTDSRLATVVRGGGATLAALLALGLAWLTLFGMSRRDDSEDIVCDILITDLTSNCPMRIRRNVNDSEPPLLAGNHSTPRLDAPADPP